MSDGILRHKVRAGDPVASPAGYVDIYSSGSEYRMIDENGAITPLGAAAGSGSVFGQEFVEVSSVWESSTSSTSFVTKLQLTTGSVPIGKYRLGFSYSWHEVDTDFYAQIKHGTSPGVILYNHQQEPQEQDTDQEQPASGFLYVDVSSAGTQDFYLQYHADPTETVKIDNARLEFWRVS